MELIEILERPTVMIICQEEVEDQVEIIEGLAAVVLVVDIKTLN